MPKSTVDLEKKDVAHIVANHSDNMVGADGNHSNSVEGFLPKFNRMGTTLDEVVNRVVASAFLHNPPQSARDTQTAEVTSQPHTTRFQTFLLGQREVARIDESHPLPAKALDMYG